MLENLEIIISLISTSVCLIISLVIFGIKLYRAIKNKNYAEAMKLLQDGVTAGVAYAEQVKSITNDSLDGETKLSIAQKFVQAYCAQNGIEYQEDLVNQMIEEVIELTKVVNVTTSSDSTEISLSGTAAK